MINVTVTDGNDQEKIIIVTSYSYSRGYAAQLRGAPEDCYPGEPAALEEYDAHWKETGRPLTADEHEAFKTEIEEAIWEHVQESEADAVDEAYERLKENQLHII